ncbi:MAG: hypothetical protein K2Q10_03880, partial [Rhodospirillales bacterium]|nr:hypothetical protein [Rhodospirillales bacterium]
MIRFLRRLACFRPQVPGAATGLAFALLLTLLTLAVPVAWAQATTTPRAALHEGFARLAFDWTGQVAFSADIVNDQLVVRFDRAVQGDFKTLLKTLAPRYVAGVSVSEDRRTAAFPLAGGFTVRSFRSGDTVVVDLVDGPAPQQSQPQQPQQPPAQAPPQAPPPAAAKGAGGGVQVRATEQAGFSRLIFEWPAPVPYQIAKHGDHATIAFARRGSFDLQAMRGVLPTDIQAEEAGQGETSSTVVLALPAGARLRHFSDGRNVVVDVVRPADAQPPRQADGTKPPPLAPPPGQAV